MSQESRPDLERELGEVRREVIEARNLVIKTDNLLKNLHAEVKMVGKRQEDFQRRQWVSSGAAYFVVAALCVGFAWVYASARASSASGDRERIAADLSKIRTEQDKSSKDGQEKAQASASAASVYRMMTTLPGDERLKGIDAMAKIDMNKISVLERQALQDRAVLLRKEAGDSAFERGKAAFRRGDMKAASEDLARYVAMNPGPAETMDASFFLGAAYNNLKQHDKAVPLLTAFVNGDRRSKSREYAMLLLAGSLEATGQLEKAAETARDALGTYINGEFNGQLRGRLASVKRAMRPADPATGVAPATAAPPVAGAPPAAN